MGGIGAGIAGGILSGIGKGLVRREERSDKVKAEAKKAAFEGVMAQMQVLTGSPDFDPQAIPDITKAIGQTYDMVYGHQAHGKGKNSPPTPGAVMTQVLDPLLTKVYPAGKGSPPKPSIGSQDLGETVPGQSWTRQVVPPVPGTQGTPDIKGPIVPGLGERRALAKKSGEEDILAKGRAAERKDVFAFEQGEKEKLIEGDRRKALEFAQQFPPGSEERRYYEAQGAGLQPFKEPSGGTFKPIDFVTPDGRSAGTFWVDTKNPANVRDTQGKPAVPPVGAQPAPKASGQELTGEAKSLRWAHDVQLKDKASPGSVPAKDLLTAKDIISSFGQHAQALQFQINQGGASGLTDEDLRSLSQMEILTGKAPTFRFRDMETQNRYNKVKAEEIRSEGGAASAAASGAEFQANKSALAGLTKARETMQGAREGTNAEIDRATALAGKVNLSKFKTLNELDQYLASHYQDSPDLARFREAITAARYRYNSMITSMRTAGGTATNAVRAETAEEILNRTMGPRSLVAALQEMKIGMQNVQTGLDNARASLLKRMDKSKAPPVPGEGSSVVNDLVNDYGRR